MFNKEEYWKRREEKKRGQGDKYNPVFSTTAQALTINNQGGVYVRNRATKRRRPPTDNWDTKSTHKINKIRSQHAKRRNQRKLARARKARQESNSKIS